MNDIHGYVGAYAVHALDEELRIVFAEHLTECESCRREVQEFRETLARLSTLSSSPPPPALKADVMDAIGRTRIEPPPDPARQADPPDSLRSSVLSAIHDPPAPPIEAGRGSDRQAGPASTRRSRWLSLAVAASVILAVLFGGFAVIQQRRIEQIEQAQQSARPVTELLAAADLQTYPIDWPDGSRGSYLVSRHLGRALVTGAVPAVEPERTYQLWTIRDGAARPGPTFRPGAVAVWDVDLGGVQALAISNEPAGGSDRPTEVEVLTKI